MFFLTVILNLLIGSSLLADDLILVPAGEVKAIWMVPQSTKSKKTKLPIIKVDSFKIMKYPVTNLDYARFLEKNKRWTKELTPRLYADETYLSHWEKNKKREKGPVTQVSWFSARAYCQSHQMRLPNLNEWEYVSAASETKKDASKDELFLRRILDWYGEPKEDHLKNVGTIYKNIYGVWDMHGLIWEWIEDFNSSFVTGESREDSSLNKNMFCGSGALSMGDKENYAAFMRFAFRSSLKGNSTVWNLGFRCVRDI